MTQSAQLSLIDSGAPKPAAQCGLGHRFRYWRGVSGRRYLFTVMDASEIGDIQGAVVVLAVRDGIDRFRGVDVVAPGDSGEADPAEISARLVTDPRLFGFVHFLADRAEQRLSIIGDFLAVDERLAA
jgi:hypothetical protein